MADPDLQIMGGPGHPDPMIRGRGWGQSPKNFFSAIQASAWSKYKRGQTPQAPLLDLCLLFSGFWYRMCKDFTSLTK